MKQVILILIIGIFSSVSVVKAQDAYEVQTKVYQAALKNYDLQAASIALYNMIALKPEKKDLTDSLAILYFMGQRYAQAYHVGKQILDTDPKRMDILELVAVSEQSLGMVKESLNDYNTLYQANKSLYYLYQIATLQYQLKRYGECVTSLDNIINDPKGADEKVNISIQGGSQEVPLKAAALNIKGICAMDMNQPDAARSNFDEALKTFPDFVLAKGNLQILDKNTAKGNGASPGKSVAPEKQTKPAPSKSSEHSKESHKK